jgi:O-antigen/teichoic acid export membrane protein
MTAVIAGRATQPPSVRRNLLANYIGKVWGGFCGVVFIPLYVKFMGIEAFGLVGFYAILVGVLALLDLGFSATITRELANKAHDDQQAQRLNDLLKTIQGFYWLSAGVVAGLVALNARWLARNWFNANTLPASTVEQVIMLMGVAISGQMLLGFYSAGLLGLQRHVSCNAINALVSTLRFAGAAVILWLVSSSIRTFFIWQVIATFAGVVVVALLVWRHMPPGRAAFRPELLRDVWRFTAGIFANSGLAMLIYQADKIVMSKTLPLEQFGYYAFAVSAVGLLQYLGNPIFVTFFPSFTQKVALGNQAGLVAQYHRATQMLAVATIPAGGVLVFFSKPLVLAWTGNAVLATNTGLLISLLSLGTLLYVMNILPYSLQLAHAWTRLTVLSNLALFIALVPLLWLAVRSHGATGAAVVWMVLNGLHLVGSVGLMHRRILIGEQVRWYLRDLFPAAVIVVVLGTIAQQIVATPTTRLFALIWLGAMYTLFLMGAVLVSYEIRTLFLEQCRRLPQFLSSYTNERK